MMRVIERSAKLHFSPIHVHRVGVLVDDRPDSKLDHVIHLEHESEDPTGHQIFEEEQQKRRRPTDDACRHNDTVDEEKQFASEEIEQMPIVHRIDADQSVHLGDEKNHKIAETELDTEQSVHHRRIQVLVDVVREPRLRRTNAANVFVRSDRVGIKRDHSVAELVLHVGERMVTEEMLMAPIVEGATVHCESEKTKNERTKKRTNERTPIVNRAHATPHNRTLGG